MSSLLRTAPPDHSLSLLPKNLQLPEVSYYIPNNEASYCMPNILYSPNCLLTSAPLPILWQFYILSLSLSNTHTSWWLYYQRRWSFQYPRVIFFTSFSPITTSFILFQPLLHCLILQTSPSPIQASFSLTFNSLIFLNNFLKSFNSINFYTLLKPPIYYVL